MTFFEVDPQELLISGNKAGLQCRRPGWVCDQKAFNAGLATDQSHGLVALGVSANHTDQGHITAQGGDVARNIARGAQHDQLPGPSQDRDWSFRRNAMDIAIDKPVDHDVADTHNPHPAEGFKQLLEDGEIHGHQAVMSV